MNNNTNIKQLNASAPMKKGSNSQEESFLTNFITFFETSSNTFGFMMKSHFKGSSFYLLNLFIPIMVTFGAFAFLTVTNGFAFILYISLTFAGLATYGTLFFNIRKSTMLKNIHMTSNEAGTLYFATFFTLLVSIFITAFVSISTGIFLDKIGFISHAMNVGNGEAVERGTWYTDYSQVWWGMIFYYILAQTCVCFSLAFFFEKTTSTQKNFFLMTMIYLLAGIFFAGAMTGTLYYDPAAKEVGVITDSTDQALFDGVPPLPPYLWGNPVWVVGQLFPHYGINQLFFNSFAAGGHHVLNGVSEYNSWNQVNLFTSVTTGKVLYYFLQSWIWVAILIYMSGMMERFKEKGSK